MKGENIVLIFFAALLVFSVSMLVLGNSQMTGYVTSGSTVSNVTIVNYLSIAMSTNLQAGILFGSVSALPATNINATHNYDGGSSASTMNLSVSTDSNVNVDFCIKANANLQDAGTDVIGIGNETYANATSTDATTPAVASEVPLTTSNVKAGVNIAKGASNHFRVWLDIPAAQAPGTYNNTIMFEGVATGGACS